MIHNDDKSKKSTLKVDEEEILKYAKKIEKNAVEDKNFSQKIDDFIGGKLKANEVVKVGTTPYCLRILGAEPVPLIVPQNVLANSLYSTDKLSNHTKSRHTEQHSIPKEILGRLPQIARNPALIAKGNSPGTLILISEIKNSKGENVIVPIKLNVQGNRTLVNKVSSIYGKKNINNYLQSLQNSDGILAINKEKAVRLYEDTGSQFPQSLTAIRFDDSIAYTTQNVKGFEKNLEVNLSQKDEKNQQHNKSAPKKTFTFSRKKLNENARKIREQPHEHKQWEKEPPNHGSI